MKVMDSRMQPTRQPRIYVAGHRGMVGSAIVRALTADGQTNIVTRTHAELDLTDQTAVRAFFQNERIDQVYLAAAKVGGIHANSTYPAEFIHENLAIQTNVIHEAWRAGVQKLLFLGSSCIYPRDCPQPIKEEYLLTGPLEPTNEPYAIAKIAGIKMCESYNRQYGTDYRCIMPCNLYGPGDNYNLANSHVIPAMIRKFHLAKLARQLDLHAIIADEKRYGEIPLEVKAMIGLSPEAPISVKSKISRRISVSLWGTGTPRREFLHVSDLATACVLVMDSDRVVPDACAHPIPSHINVGYGKDVTICAVADIIAKIVGYQGSIEFDRSKPDGTPKKLLHCQRLRRLGFQPRICLEEGIKHAYSTYYPDTLSPNI